MIKNVLKIGMLLIMAISITNCQGDDGVDGEDGAAGISGVNGTNGTNGVDGTDGENAVGFDDTAAYGAISISLDGTRVDGEPFTDTTDFIYTDATAPSLQFLNSYFVDEEEGITFFQFGRSSSIPFSDSGFRFKSEGESGIPGGAADVNIFLAVEDLGLETERIADLDIYIDGYNVISEDLVSFIFGAEFEYSEESEEPLELKGAGIILPEEDDDELVQPLEISDISFNSETNELSFSFTALLSEEANSTDNEVEMSATIDVVLIEAINSFKKLKTKN